MRKKCILKMLYNLRHTLAVNVESVWASGGRRLSFLACNSLALFSTETSDRVKWDVKSFIFEVSS